MSQYAASLVERHLQVPKYLQLAEQLRAQVASGELQPGARLPSFNELRARYGSAQNTVDKAFTLLEHEGLVVRKPNRGVFVAGMFTAIPEADEVELAEVETVRPPMSGRVSGVKSALAPPLRLQGIAPVPALTRHTKRRPSNIIGVGGWAFEESDNSSYWAKVMGGMRAAAREAEMNLLLLAPSASSAWESADGVILCDWSVREISRFMRPGQLCVSLLVETVELPSVVADDYTGACMATEHLIGLGHTRIAHLQSNSAVSLHRARAYRDALNAAGIEPLLRWTRPLAHVFGSGREFVRAGRAHVAHWLQEDWDELGLTALLAQNDETAIGAIEALQEAGKRVPEDVSVVGFDGLEVSTYVTPRLTTVGLPLWQLGVTAVETLCAQLRGDTVPVEPQVLPVELCVRASTAPPPSLT